MGMAVGCRTMRIWVVGKMGARVCSPGSARSIALRSAPNGQLLWRAASTFASSTREGSSSAPRPSFPSAMFDRALGFTEQAGRITEALAFFAEHGVDGEIVLDPTDLPPGVEPRVRLDAYLGASDGIAPAPVDGLALRVIDGDAIDAWTDVILEAYAPIPEVAAVWRSAAPHLVGAPERILVTGELDGRAWRRPRRPGGRRGLVELGGGRAERAGTGDPAGDDRGADEADGRTRLRGGGGLGVRGVAFGREPCTGRSALDRHPVVVRHRTSVEVGRLPYDAAVTGPSSASLRVERTGPGGVVARVTLPRRTSTTPSTPTLIADLRTAFAALAREEPTELRAVVLAGDGPSFCAGADIAWMRAAMALDREAQRAGRDGDGRDVRGDRHLPGAGHRPGPRRGARGRDGPVRGRRPRHRRDRRPVRVHRDTARDPARRSSARSSIAKIGETPRPGAVPRRPAVRRDAGPADRARPRGRRGRGGARCRGGARSRDLLAAGPTAARAAKAIVREVRGLGHGSSKWHTARVIARQRQSEEAQEGFRAFGEKRRPAWAPDPDGREPSRGCP